MREEKWIYGKAQIVIAHKGCGENQNYQKRSENFFCALLRGRRGFGLTGQKPKESGGYGQAKEKTLIGTAVGEDRNSQSQEQGVTYMGTAEEPSQRPQNKSASRGGHGTAPIAIHPVRCGTEFDCGEYGAEQGPSGREPRLP